MRDGSLQSSSYNNDLLLLDDEGLVGEASTILVHPACYGRQDVEAVLAEIQDRKEHGQASEWYEIERKLAEVAGFRQIGGLGRSYHTPTTHLSNRLEGTFRLRSVPGTLFRVRPDCDGLITADNEVVVQSHDDKDGWLDFSRENQFKVLRLLAK